MIMHEQVWSRSRADKWCVAVLDRRRFLQKPLISLFVSGWVLSGVVLMGQPVVPKEITVPAGDSFTGESFTYTRVLRERSEVGAIYDLRYPSPIMTASEANNTVPAELYLPAGISPEMEVPGVVCLHIMGPGNFDLERLVCLALARQGVATLFFKLPYYGERAGPTGKADLIASADFLIQTFDQGVDDARRAVDILSALTEVNSQRIGITGISLGGIQAATICGYEPRIGKAFLMLAGGDLKTMINSSHEARRIKASIESLPEEDQTRVWAFFDGFDPINAGPALRKLADRGDLRMLCAEKDEAVSPESSRQLARAAGFEEQITWLPGHSHYSAMAHLPQILMDVAAFFAADVPVSWVPPPANREKTPLKQLGVFLGGLSVFLTGVPEDGTAHLVGGEATFSLGGKPQLVSFDYANGGNGRFRFVGDIPKVGRAGFGAGEYPWLVGKDDIVFCGTKAFEPGLTANELIDPNRWMAFKMLSGVLGSAALSPGALKTYLSIAPLDSLDGKRRIRANIQVKKVHGTLDLTFLDDVTVDSVAWDFGTSKGEVKFRYWRLNSATDGSLFDPDPEFKRYEVLQGDLLQVFASVFEYGMEGME